MKRVVTWFAAGIIVASVTGCSNDALSPSGDTPSTPQGVIATNGGSGWVLSWTPNVDADLDGYEVYRKPAYTLEGYNFALVQKTPASVTSSPIVVEGGEWIYHVRARDLEGNLSAPSTGVLVEVPSSGGGSDLPADEGVVRATR